MRIITWNVNSVRLRLPHLLEMLKEHQPDAVCLQELKCQDEQFPRLEIEEAGYQAEVFGQKSFNGVAILTRTKLEDVRRGLPGDESDEQARYIEGVLHGDTGPVRIASIYLPNGNPLGTEKFPYKLRWMERLHAHARELLQAEEKLVLAGDYNVIPDQRDASDPASWVNDALFQPESRAAFRSLLNLGLTDALRATTDEAGLYTFWDYQAGAWARNVGIRIDHLLLSPQAADGLRGVSILKEMRALEKPSDHVPVMANIA
ncbi:MAG: exodeoxyribonuclease III [Bosea sp. (in: a-proteobacteria)]